MTKALKYGVVTLLVIILLLLILPFFIPLNSYKPVIISKVKEATGYDLTINGDIKFSIMPNPTISLKEIALSSGTKESSLITIKKADVALKLLPLITGNIEIGTIELNEPVVNLEVTPQGKKNWEISALNNLSFNNTQEVIKEDKFNKNYKLPILIEKLKITNGILIYKKGNEQNIFDNINIDTTMQSFEGPIDVTATFNSLGYKINVNANIAKLEKIMPINAVVNISDTHTKVKGTFDIEKLFFTAEIIAKGNSKDFGAPTELHGDYEIAGLVTANNKQIVIKDTKINYRNIELSMNGDYDIEQNIIKSNIVINPGNITVVLNSNTDKSSILNGNIALQANAIDPLIKALNFKFNPLPITNQKLSLTANVAYKPQEIIIQNINFTANNANLQGTTKLKTQLQNLTISHDLKINNTNNFIALFGINNAIPIGAMQLNGEIQKAKDTLHINDKIEILGTEISIKGNISLATSKPNLDLDIYSSFINLDKITNSVSNRSRGNNTNNAAGSATQTSSSTPWSNNPINLSFLNNIDGNIKVVINKLIQASLVLDNVKAQLNIANGKLNINSFTTNIFGGVLNSNGHISGNKEQEATFKIDLKNTDLKNIIPQAEKIKITDGLLSIQANLTSKGQSIYKYVNNLQGQFNLNAINGRVSGFDLNKIVDAVHNIKNVESILQIINSSFTGGQTSFNNLAINGNIDHGTVKLTECKLAANKAVAEATGEINLPQYIMDIHANVDIENLPSIPVKLNGFLNNPQYKLDTKALQAYLVKNILNNVVQDIKNGKTKPENVIKDVLGISKKQNNNQSNTEESTDKNNNPLNKSLQDNLKKLF